MVSRQMRITVQVGCNNFGVKKKPAHFEEGETKIRLCDIETLHFQHAIHEEEWQRQQNLLQEKNT